MSAARLAAALCFLAVYPGLPAHAAPEKESIDLSIIEERDSLAAFLSPSERVALLEAEAMIERGESDLRSGGYLKNSKPSKLKSEADVKADAARGEALMEQGEAAVRAGQARMVALLEAARQKKAQASAPQEETFELGLETAAFDEALRRGAEALLDASRRAGYTTVLFDGLFKVTGASTEPMSDQRRNDAYDTLIEVDGTRFSVTVPIDMSLAEDETGRQRLTFANESAFEGSKVALLAIERLSGSEPLPPMLRMRAIDPESHRVIAGELFALEPAEDEGEAYSYSVVLDTRLTAKIAGVEPGYAFTIDAEDTTRALQSQQHQALIEHALLSHARLKLVASDFVERAYGDGEMIDRTATGTITAARSEAEDSSGLPLSVSVDGSDRVLNLGSITL